MGRRKGSKNKHSCNIKHKTCIECNKVFRFPCHLRQHLKTISHALRVLYMTIEDDPTLNGLID